MRSLNHANDLKSMGLEPRYQAHLAVQRALMSGALEKQACEVCGAAKVDAHHDRYDEPLNVRWLCRCHYVKLHQHGEDMSLWTGSRRGHRTNAARDWQRCWTNLLFIRQQF